MDSASWGRLCERALGPCHAAAHSYILRTAWCWITDRAPRRNGYVKNKLDLVGREQMGPHYGTESPGPVMNLLVTHLPHVADGIFLHSLTEPVNMVPTCALQPEWCDIPLFFASLSCSSLS